MEKLSLTKFAVEAKGEETALVFTIKGDKKRIPSTADIESAGRGLSRVRFTSTDKGADVSEDDKAFYDWFLNFLPKDEADPDAKDDDEADPDDDEAKDEEDEADDESDGDEADPDEDEEPKAKPEKKAKKEPKAKPEKKAKEPKAKPEPK